MQQTRRLLLVVSLVIALGVGGAFAPSLLRAGAATTTSTQSTTTTTATFKSNETASHEASESAARETAENNGTATFGHGAGCKHGASQGTGTTSP
jgi:hypothetical protein